MYAERYPDISSDKWTLIANGYDEENFIRAEKKISKDKGINQIVLLHSGILYPVERDPSFFFQALSELMIEGTINSEGLKIILRATGHDDLIKNLVDQYGLNKLVFIEAGVPYESALAEMMTVDGLIVFQASNCNHQIPAKIYEYLRARKPIFALTDPDGDTAAVLIDANINSISSLDDKDSIKIKFSSFIEELKKGAAPVANEKCVLGHSRKARTQLLAELLNEGN